MAFKDSKRSACRTLLSGLFCLLNVPLSAMSQTQPTAAAPTPVPATSTTPTSEKNTKLSARLAIESGPAWNSLSAAQQAALKPMQADWASLDANRKKKWLAVAQRYQTMPQADQARLKERMSQWAKLTPAQRSAARDNYSAVLSSPSSSGDVTGKNNLNEQWAKYQALSPEKKSKLNEQANKVADTSKVKPLATP